MKTIELTGRALDYAVALAEGSSIPENFPAARQADDIIDRELIGTDAGDGSFKGNKKWSAWMPGQMAFTAEEEITNTTRREAAMRAYVLNKLGDDVDIPKELK